MALPASGPISLTMIATEAIVSTAAKVNLNNPILRSLAKKPTDKSIIKFSDFYNKSKYSFTNGDFSQGLLGWTVFNSAVQLNGFSNILGYPTPNDNNPDEIASPGSYTSSFSSNLPPGVTAPTQALVLSNTGTTSPYGRAHGPYAISNDPVTLEVGDQVEFYWQANAAADAYDVYSYLLNTSTGFVIPLVNETGATSTATKPWTKVTVNIDASNKSPNKNIPDYKFVFISGSWDATGGQATGANLAITSINVKKWFQVDPTQSILTVTGATTGGTVWGSNPYTDDSDFNVAAVHAGLVQPGETKQIRAKNLGTLTNYPSSTANGITTTAWTTDWVGILLSDP